MFYSYVVVIMFNLSVLVNYRLLIHVYRSLEAHAVTFPDGTRTQHDCSELTGRSSHE